MIIIGMESKAMKMPSLFDRGPLKPPLSSATRQQERIKRQTAATAAPDIEKKNQSLNLDNASQCKEYMVQCRLPIM